MQIIAFYTLCIITLSNNKPISNQQRLRWFLYCGFTQLPTLQTLPPPRRPRSETQIIKNEFSTKFLHLPSDPHSSHLAGTSKARQNEISPFSLGFLYFDIDPVIKLTVCNTFHYRWIFKQRFSILLPEDLCGQVFQFFTFYNTVFTETSLRQLLRREDSVELYHQ